MGNPQWKVTNVNLTDSKGPAPVPVTLAVQDALTQVAAAPGAPPNAVTLAQACRDTHTDAPAGLGLPGHKMKVVTAWNASLGVSGDPDWGRIVSALDHNGM